MRLMKDSARDYEAWLRSSLDGDVVEDDLVEKHRKMAGDAFTFLRATYWRWAETILDVCRGFDVEAAPPLLAVGDVHLENFGTWRDAEGRLAWGVNDFDEAAVMPYPLDLVRLAVSALLTRPAGAPSPREICRALIDGYRRGIEDPEPTVLELDHGWLRELVVLSEKGRQKFWKKLDGTHEQAPARFAAALAAALPEAGLGAKTFRRTAGTGSLGRPRWVAVADWRGGPVVREAKALVPSGWHYAHDPADRRISVAEIASGRHRATDAHYRVDDGIVVRRLSPNSRKVEVEKDASELLKPEMLAAMGFELASVHAGDASAVDLVRRDARGRDADWLDAVASVAARAVESDFDAWKRDVLSY